jgi:hypothetical protein
MGKYNGKVSAQYNPPRKWVLEKPLSYTNQYMDVPALQAVGVDVKKLTVTCDVGFETDLASVPRTCWTFIAPWDVARAAIIHDLLYKTIRQYRSKNSKGLKSAEDPKVVEKAKKAADKLFLMAMLDAEPSVPKWKIYSAYYAVVFFGYGSIVPKKDD